MAIQDVSLAIALTTSNDFKWILSWEIRKHKSKTEAEIFSSNKVLQLSNIKVSLSVINGGRCASVWVI